ncbi:molybdate ABC transporter substrate-binding protein [Colidextribacter sp. 210702-DFI.3.9]|nr:molybdate ABC transporter substrate-binding protein [Colidextribacter sp. 210702-DFI.3.9]MCG4468930.1 molybdate ABC transporter substrate-binding protein [Lawsonibacter sp. DFI.6.74]MCG4773566.1 molybdate ABC transporter substrate-binding protein [Lawsonibacter sp. DFI.5.51]
MKRLLSLALAAAMALSLTACGDGAPANGSASGSGSQFGGQTELVVFAAASMTETLTQIAEQYQTVDPGVKLVFNFASSGDLLTQIKEGAVCDLFISAAPKQMNALDGALAQDAEKNPEGLDMLAEGSRMDLLQNKVTLAVPEGNPKGVENFDQLADLLRSGDVLLAVGNSDVPVGQYSQKIFAYYGLDQAQMDAAGVLTYGSNVKEVTTAVSEGTVDCGIIYATDAYSAGLTAVDAATSDMCGQVIYPAAVLKDSQNQEKALALLDYLNGDEATAIFENVGFSKP